MRYLESQQQPTPMPELPEVETTCRGIAPHIVGRTVREAIVREPRLRWPVPAKLNLLMSGARFLSVSRRAKYCLLATERGTLMVHLGMSGSLRIMPADTPPLFHDHIDVVLDDGRCLRYHDPRRFGSFHWLESQQHPLLDHLGPEPLSDTFNGAYLYERSRGRRIPVKQFIMDGKVVVGVGNIYANEALYLTGIRPDRPAGGISRKRYRSLAEHVKEVLQKAIEAGGTTLRDFVREDGTAGYFRHELLAYGRGGQPCFACGRKMKEVVLGQRATVFCTRCQS